MEILGKILGSIARVKIMRLFLLNSEQIFKNKEISKRSRVSSSNVLKELRILASIDFVKKSSAGWIFNKNFRYANELENLLVNSENLDKKTLTDNFKKVGRIKLLIVSGIFIKNKDSRADLLIVGDNIKRNKVEEVIRKMEAEIGAELIYAIFDTKEFIYRLNMYDKLVRDIIDFPHEVIIETKELNFTKIAQ